MQKNQRAGTGCGRLQLMQKGGWIIVFTHDRPNDIKRFLSFQTQGLLFQDLACCRCIVGHEPREFDASRGLVLSNLSEMLVRQLEHKWAESEARQSSVQLMRSLACYEEAFLFLDTSREGDWRALHMNMAASKLLGRHILLTIMS